MKNPLFRLAERPNVTETIYQDVFRTFSGEKDVDIWSTRLTDYLDDTRLLTEEENQSYEVQQFHIQMEMSTHQGRVYTLKKEAESLSNPNLSVIEEL